MVLAAQLSLKDLNWLITQFGDCWAARQAIPFAASGQGDGAFESHPVCPIAQPARSPASQLVSQPVAFRLSGLAGSSA